MSITLCHFEGENVEYSTAKRARESKNHRSGLTSDRVLEMKGGKAGLHHFIASGTIGGSSRALQYQAPTESCLNEIHDSVGGRSKCLGLGAGAHRGIVGRRGPSHNAQWRVASHNDAGLHLAQLKP